MKTPSGTKEWAPHSANIFDGCIHDCRYCYAHAMKKRFKQLNGFEWQEEQLRLDPRTVEVSRKSGRIMYPTAHDIAPQHLEESIIFIRRQLETGNTLLIVSKPHAECIKRLCEEFEAYKDHMTFRFTIGSVENEVLHFWEPGAPTFEERLESLQIAFALGFATSVSVEPMLEGDLDALVSAVRPFVTGTIWLGKINRLKSILSFNSYKTREILARADALIRSQNDEAIKQLRKKYEGDPKIRFKDSIRKVVGLEFHPDPVMDI